MTTALTFEAIDEAKPGPRWRTLFTKHWPRYRAWFLHEGEAARTSYSASARALREHMPELVETYERLCQLAGGGDIESRFLAMWEPPSYLSGCSQAVLRTGDPVLARNYDYAPERLEGAILRTHWNRPVIGMSDCLWGLLDGVNDAGLAVSLAFGGRKVVGSGFGVPLVVRYLLETSETTEDARRTLRRLRYHLAHTLTIVDRSGDVATAFLAPDRDVELTDAPVATNHQREVEWAEHAHATRTLERERALRRLIEREGTTTDAFVAAFLRPPLYKRNYRRGMGTLYTAAYAGPEGRVDYLWPGVTWAQSFDRFEPGTRTIRLAESTAA